MLEYLMVSAVSESFRPWFSRARKQDTVDAIVVVGATDPSGVAPFSGGASFDWPGTSHPRVTKPDLVAPGVRIYSSVPPFTVENYGTYEFAKLDGTSMATPHVASTAALSMSAKPNASAIQVADAMRKTARHPTGRKNRPNRWGWGQKQPLDALKRDVARVR